MCRIPQEPGNGEHEDMTTTTSQPWGSASTPGDVRVSDAERDQTVSMLQQAYTDGRIDKDELDRRIDETLAARTKSELAAALRGLPAGGDGVGPSHGMTTGAVPQQVPTHAKAVTSLDRSWAMVAHWLGLATSFIGPGIVAATKGRRSRYVREQAMEAVNFQITAIGAWIAVGIVTGVTFGVAGFLMPLLGLVWMAMAGVGGLSAATGNSFRYPYILRLFR